MDGPASVARGNGMSKESDGFLSRVSERAKSTRLGNITAARSVADAVRTSLGPRGMDKMVQTETGDVLVTNDGATILEKMNVQHPAAKTLVQLSKAQDIEAGDGTTSVVVICGALLEASLELLEIGIHPTIISECFQIGLDKSLGVLESMSTPVDLENREELVRAASTSLNSKVVAQHASLLAPLSVDAVLSIAGDERQGADLRNIRVVKKLAGTVDETELIPGLLLNQTAESGASGPTRIEKAKIALIQFQLSPPKTDMENSVVVQDYAAMDRILKEERTYILQLVKKIKATGANVLLIQKSILRDAVTDLSLHFLAKVKIMAVTDIERDEIEFISKTLDCVPIASPEALSADKLGKAELVEEVSFGSEKVVKVTGISTTPDKPKTVSVLLRGSSQMVLDEAERSIHDAMCVVRCLVKKRAMIPGGAAPEMEVSVQLAKLAKQLPGHQGFCVGKYAKALEVIPYTLAENAGLNPIEIVTELRKLHAEGLQTYGINVKKGTVTDIGEEQVVMPLLVFTSALSLATEAVRMILKIDDIVMTR
ncbi:hypothetical protein NDN08_002167 [Rhodosorus marinus]|uniref:T-complex protein 1 subunit delta n=1 Tax=Rhodosorus marinus TaxID=101924 RepID=A0AAV8USY2_9RHOD|nr:hypothetical protein NDN08_002167 [Rhodosorus marinus]